MKTATKKDNKSSPLFYFNFQQPTRHTVTYIAETLLYAFLMGFFGYWCFLHIYYMNAFFKSSSAQIVKKTIVDSCGPNNKLCLVLSLGKDPHLYLNVFENTNNKKSLYQLNSSITVYVNKKDWSESYTESQFKSLQKEIGSSLVPLSILTILFTILFICKTICIFT